MSEPHKSLPVSEPDPDDTPLTPASLPVRLLKHWDWQAKLRWFAAEILIVVAGVLIALAINAWWQGRQDAASEATYLALIHRDLGQMADNLEDLLIYQDRQVQDGVTAYRILSMAAPSEREQDAASQGLESLLGRRTIHVIQPAYEDLINTGNLRLIRNQTLRDRLVSFYEEAERLVDIHNKNNAIFVDELYAHEMLRAGLLYYNRQSELMGAARSDSLLRMQTRGGYVDEPDPIWSLPPDAPEWNTVRAILLQRMRVAAYAREFAQQQLEDTRDLQRLVETELNR